MEHINRNGFILHQETLVKDTDSLHYHPSYELFIVVKGSTTLLVNDKFVSAAEKDIVLLKPNVIHKNIGQKLHDRYSVHFTNAYLLSCFSDGLVKSLTAPFENHKATVTPGVFDQILNLLTHIKNNPHYACIHTAEILALLTDENNLQKTQFNMPPKTTDHILEYIRNNYAAISGLNDIADGVHISKQYLCHLIKKETDTTVSEYLNSVRINNACEMLRHGRHTITQTAVLCGYNSTAYFCRIFKKIMHMTPKEYQKIYGNVT